MNAGLNFVAVTLLARYMGPSDYGVFSVALALVLLLADASSLGMNPTLIRYAALYLQRDEPYSAAAVFSYALRLRTYITLGVVVGGLLFGKPIALLLLKNPKVVSLMPLTMLGLIPVVLLGYVSAVFQSFLQFRHFLVVNTIVGIVKLGGVVALHLLGAMTPLNALAVFAAAPLFSIVFSLFVIHPMAFTLKQRDLTFKKEFGFYSFWMAVWAVFSLLQARLDLFMVTNMLGVHAAGQYAIANQLAMAFTVTAGAFATVLNPRLAGMTVPQLRRFSLYIPHIAGLVAFVVLIITAAGHLFIPAFLGAKYAASLPVFTVIMISMFFFGSGFAPNSILNALGKPFVFSLTAGSGLLLTFVGDLLLLPKFGVIGAGYTAVASRLILVGVSLGFAYYFLRTEGARQC